MAEIPAEAIRLAMLKRADLLMDRPDPMVLSDETLTRLMLEAAAPLIVAAERASIAKMASDLGATVPKVIVNGEAMTSVPFADLIAEGEPGA